jgi:hypothetical protein
VTWTSGGQIEIGQTTTSLITGIDLIAGASGTVKANGQRVFAENYHPNADKLTTARNINGVAFDGTANITVADATKLPLSGGSLTGSLSLTSGTNASRNIYTQAPAGTTSDTNVFYFGVNNGPSDGLGTALGTGITWKTNYGSGYTKRSAGIMQIAEGNYFRAGLGFFTNGTSNSTTDWVERMRIHSGGTVDIYSGLSVTGNIAVSGTVDGRDVAADGTKLDGIATGANNYSFPYTVSASASNSTVVQRHSSGYIYANYFNTTPNDIATGSITKIVAESGNDGFMRHATAPAVRSFLNVADGANNYSLPATPSVTSLNLADKITHTGDTDTYFQFHGNDLARMVIAGAEVQEWGANYTLFSDNDQVRLGTSSDFRMWHDGTNTYFRNYLHAAGSFYWQGEGTGGTNHNLISMHNDSTAPYIKLYYDGVSVLETVSGGVNITGDLTASGEVISLSDINFKENIINIEAASAVNIVNSLRPVSYNMVGEDATNVKVGFIAQEVEKALPEVVYDNNGVLGVSYGNMIAVLTSALQDALTRIEELENVISNK